MEGSHRIWRNEQIVQQIVISLIEGYSLYKKYTI